MRNEGELLASSMLSYLQQIQWGETRPLSFSGLSDRTCLTVRKQPQISLLLNCQSFAGQLSNARTRLVCNKTLARIGMKRLRLDAFIPLPLNAYRWTIDHPLPVRNAKRYSMKQASLLFIS